MENAPVDADLPVPAYGAISVLLTTDPAPTHTLERITYIDCYMDDVISAVQGVAERQHRVFDSTVCALKWISPLLPREAKYSVSGKNILAGEGYWECVKEVLR